ncbi:Sorting nexin-31 [Chelonia mydas]|uniref:Sorting nexin-31 n=1 Tax=Chelonia mydas TaxID=8469 RepID=M7ATV6_CHEMY|nr:Sorting nexin-31 [Chelonia mydas]
MHFRTNLDGRWAEKNSGRSAEIHRSCKAHRESSVCECSAHHGSKTGRRVSMLDLHHCNLLRCNPTGSSWNDTFSNVDSALVLNHTGCNWWHPKHPLLSTLASFVAKNWLLVTKQYMDPSLDNMLMDCRASVNLLYMQALQEIEKNWVKPTDGQLQKLELLQKAANKMKFLELVQEVQHYGYIQLDPCTCDYPEVGCSAAVHIGNNEISCCIKLPSNQTKEVSFKINRVRCWQVTFLGAITQPKDQGHEQTLELRFEYNDSDSWRWIVFYTKQSPERIQNLYPHPSPNPQTWSADIRICGCGYKADICRFALDIKFGSTSICDPQTDADICQYKTDISKFAGL